MNVGLAVMAGLMFVVASVVIFGPSAWAAQQDSGSWMIAASLWACFSLVATVVLLVSSAPSEHAWEGGHGSATECRYESRPILTGKVTTMHTFTVCS